MTKVDLESMALNGFEKSGVKQDKKNWDLYKKAYIEGYMSQHTAIRIKLEVAIDMIDKLTMGLLE